MTFNCDGGVKLLMNREGLGSIDVLIGVDCDKTLLVLN